MYDELIGLKFFDKQIFIEDYIQLRISLSAKNLNNMST